MAISVEQFTKQLVESGLMSADDAMALIASLPEASQPKDGEALARALVKQKKLTSYQAQEVYAGRGKKLTLGNYVVLEVLGKGGMGMVLKAEHRRMKRLVALKVLASKVTDTPAALRRFQREVEAAARLTHPHIVSAYDADEAGGVHFLVMEYVEGRDLYAVIKQDGAVPYHQALDFIIQAARGLEYAHQRGVVHRDIKPPNLLLDNFGVVKILDMGIARIDSPGSQDDALTGTGQIMGTVDFMAPEQAVRAKNADGRADIYSLGVTLFYLLTGRTMYEGETAIEKLMAHQTQPIPLLTMEGKAVSPRLQAVYQRMVAKSPADRFQNMSEVIAELEGCRGEIVWSSGRAAQDSNGDFASDVVPASNRGQSTLAAKDSTVRAKPAKEPHPTINTGMPQVETDPLPESVAETADYRAAIERRGRGSRESLMKVIALSGVAAGVLALTWFWLLSSDPQTPQAPAEGTQTAGAASASSASGETTTSDTPNLTTGFAPPPAVAPFDARQALEYQEAWAGYLGLEVDSINPAGGKMVLIPPGEFLMGSTLEEYEMALRVAKEKSLHETQIGFIMSEVPQHRVVLTRPYLMGATEVTIGQYRQFAEATNYLTEVENDGGGKSGVAGGPVREPELTWRNPANVKDLEFQEDSAVGQLYWGDCAAFCNWLSEQERLPQAYEKQADSSWKFNRNTGYRLPTEAEWEFACRGGTTTWFSWGDDLAMANEFSWQGGNYTENRSLQVARRRANPFGLYDMHGNSAELCHDFYHPKFYENAAVEDPISLSTGSSHNLRGGNAALNVAVSYRSASRHYCPGKSCYLSYGFRIVRNVEPAAN